MRMTTWAFRRPQPLLRIRRADWNAMISQLGRRGEGWRESGAFLLCDRAGEPRTVTRVVYLDDLDPNCLTGAIEFDGLAYSKLWDICSAEGRRVIGDIHTHPGRTVRQSSIDADNPMIAQAGHVALIVPDLAQRAVDPRDVGVHRYDGSGWQTSTGKAAARCLLIRRFI
jgi:proteasome lid subunit RPN8/RPN11